MVYEDLCTQHPRAAVAALAYGWQLERQATNSKDYGVRQSLQQAAQAAYDRAAQLVPADASARQRAGRAPLEILTGQTLAQPWLEALLALR